MLPVSGLCPLQRPIWTRESAPVSVVLPTAHESGGLVSGEPRPDRGVVRRSGEGVDQAGAAPVELSKLRLIVRGARQLLGTLGFVEAVADNRAPEVLHLA